MANRKLTESLYAKRLLLEHGVDDVADLFSKLVCLFPSECCIELSGLLTAAQMLYVLHQTHHWQAKGDNFYGDHLLFERLYNDVLGDIDPLAEKAVGLGGVETVMLMPRMQGVNLLLSCTEPHNVMPQSTQLAERSLAAEIMFLNMCAMASFSLKEKGQMTAGLDNLLAGIQDKAEGRVYLLRQRLSNA